MISKIYFRTFYAYVIPYLVLLMVILGLMYAYPKPELHLMLNAHHTSLQDTFFKYYSVLAEWPLYVLALLPLLWKKTKMTIFFAICEMTGGAILQILKHTISHDRPDLTLPLVEGVTMYHSNSFPSGHASTFFMFSTCLYNPQNEMFAHFQTKRSIQQNEMSSQSPRKSLFSSLT